MRKRDTQALYLSTGFGDYRMTDKNKQNNHDDYLNNLGALENRYKIVNINSWDDLLENFNEQEEKWIFRGEKKVDNPLETSLKRAFEKKISDVNINEFEKGLLNEFKRKCNLYIKDLNVIPEKDDKVEWLSLMQHHGASTRLLDWTYSFFIAVFFAIEDPDTNSNYSYVWSIDSCWLSDTFTSTLDTDEKEKLYTDERKKIYEDKIFEKPKKAVYLVNPYILNERLVIQQGVFLCPGDISKTFLENLEGNFSGYNDDSKIKIYKINLKEKNDILKKLYRMNINRASLFPGLDGFAKSLSLSPLI